MLHINAVFIMWKQENTKKIYSPFGHLAERAKNSTAENFSKCDF